MMRKPIVVVLNKINEAGFDYLRDRCDLRFVDSDKVSRAEVKDALSLADAIIVRSFKVTPEVLDWSPRLAAISKHGVGFETVDVKAASAHHIPVTNTVGANSASVAEYAVTLMLATLRKIPRMHQTVLEGRFQDRLSLVFADLWERTVGLIGYGHIGRLVAKIAHGGFSARVIAYDPFVDTQAMKRDGVEKVETLDQLLAEADAISIHTPLTSQTRGMIGAAQLRLMKPTAIIVNTSRGAIIDQEALATALKEHRLYGAGIDVFDPEPPLPNNPLFADVPNIVLSPHLGGASLSSRRHTSLMAAKAALQMLAGEKPEFLLNPEVWNNRRQMHNP